MKNKKGCKKYMNGYEVIDNQNTLFLSIVDTLDWKDEEAHVLRLYEAIHKYQAYVEEKRVKSNKVSIRDRN